jgi:hypothetical protein
MLGCQSHRTQPGTADLIDVPSGTFGWKAGIDMGLARRILALTCRKHLTQNCFIHVRFINSGAGDQRLKHSCAQIMCGGFGKGAAKAADSRSCS